MLDPNENYQILYIYLCITMWQGKEGIQIYIILYYILFQSCIFLVKDFWTWTIVTSNKDNIPKD
jgi:hypothetical protein